MDSDDDVFTIENESITAERSSFSGTLNANGLTVTEQVVSLNSTNIGQDILIIN